MKAGYGYDYSALEELYYDEEVCKTINCELFKNLQLVSRPTNLSKNYDEYSFKFRKYFMDFLYNNATIEDTLNNIDNIATITYIHSNSTLGITILILNIVFILIILISFVIILPNKNEFYLNLINKSSWFIMLFGLCCFICFNYTLLGRLNTFKCLLQIFLPIIGISLVSYPILIHEIINFPEPNIYSEYVKNNKLIILFGLIILDIIYGTFIYFVTPFKINPVYIDEGKNYDKCYANSNFQFTLLFIMYCFKSIIILSIGVLTFLEYNLVSIHDDIKTVCTIISVNIIFILIYIGINVFDLKEFYFQCLFKIVIMYAVAFSNYIIMIWVRMFFEKNKNFEDKYVKSIKTETGTDNAFTDSQNKGIISKFMNYHFTKGSLSSNKLNEKSKSSNELTSKKSANNFINTSQLTE